MTDVIASPRGRRVATSTSRERLAPQTSDAQLVKFIELLFFAYRDFTGEADTLLADLGFGRAHHRVLHFVNRNPGLRVADLLGVLNITKQSLARVLKQLVEQGYIIQSTGQHDRRERRLAVTERGAELARSLVGLQARRIADALAGLGPGGAAQVERFLFAMIGTEDRDGVAALLAASELTS